MQATAVREPMVFGSLLDRVAEGYGFEIGHPLAGAVA